MSTSQAIVLAPGTGINVAELEYLCISLFLLDQSGSMNDFKGSDPPLVKVNELLHKLSEDGNADVILVGIMTFADKAAVAVPLTLAAKKPQLLSYTPGGNTSLYETTRCALEMLLHLVSTREHKKLPTDVVVTIFSDGKDSYNDRSTLAQVRALSRAARARKWTLRVVGFGVDGSEIAETMGFVDGGRDRSRDGRSGGTSFSKTSAGFEKSVMTSVIDISEITNTGRTQSRMSK